MMVQGLWNALVLVSFVSGWYIAPPVKRSDWVGMASLVVETFDDNNDNPSFFQKFSLSLRKQKTYQRYIRTAKLLRNSKYALFLAKHEGEILGMIEMGVNSDSHGAIIGLICVDKMYRQRGIGAALVARCEALAVSSAWNKTKIYADVANEQALCFFHSQNYTVEAIVMVPLQRSGTETTVQTPHSRLAKNLSRSMIAPAIRHD